MSICTGAFKTLHNFYKFSVLYKKHRQEGEI